MCRISIYGRIKQNEKNNKYQKDKQSIWLDNMIKATERKEMANKVTHHEIENSNRQSVFERLFVPRKTTSTSQSQPRVSVVVSSPKQSIPYYAQSVKFQKTISTLTHQTQNNRESSDKKQQNPEESAQLPIDINKWKPCLPNKIYFLNKQVDSKLDLSNSKTNVPQAAQENGSTIKINTPQHFFVDFSTRLKDCDVEQDVPNHKQPLTQKQIEQMLERLQAWNQKKDYKIQQEQQKRDQQEMDECTFQPEINNKTPKTTGLTMLIDRLQKQPLSYQDMFNYKNKT